MIIIYIIVLFEILILFYWAQTDYNIHKDKENSQSQKYVPYQKKWIIQLLISGFEILPESSPARDLFSFYNLI